MPALVQSLGQEVPFVRVQLAGVRKGFGAQTVLDGVSLAVGATARIGLVGPNGSGKTTLLRLLVGLELPDAGTVSRDPESLRVGYLPQQHDELPGETLSAYLARRTGVAAAERELEAASTALAAGADAAERYSVALERFLELGGGDLEPRARALSADLGLPLDLGRRVRGLSGGERARAGLAAVLLSRVDVLLLDEPTNDLDFDGLDRLERFLDAHRGALVVVSHDRAFLDRVVTSIASIEPGSRRVREWAGGWSAYAARRDAERADAYRRYGQAVERRRHLGELLAARRSQARAGGAMADRRGTQALRSKVRQAARRLERDPPPPKPFEPWQLRLSLEVADRPGDVVAALSAAVAERGSFRLGPVDLRLGAGERVAVRGPNGTGKSTLLGMLSGDVPLVAGRRVLGPHTRIGVLGQERRAYAGRDPVLARFAARTRVPAGEARTLLAKFGVGAEHVGRACDSLSPGERTRVHLAELQAARVNLLLLDEPTNHLDLEAVEQLETALATYAGTVVVVSHDRAFLATLQPTRALSL
jgi:ATPase subunit of ABC transporter with duplicated ATPase domains